MKKVITEGTETERLFSLCALWGKARLEQFYLLGVSEGTEIGRALVFSALCDQKSIREAIT